MTQDAEGRTANRGSFERAARGSRRPMASRAAGRRSAAVSRVLFVGVGFALRETSLSRRRRCARRPHKRRRATARGKDGPAIFDSMRLEKRVRQPRREEGARDGGRAWRGRRTPRHRARRSMMGREIRVKVVDGRVFVGRFECYDKQGNILMEDAMSTTLDDRRGRREQRDYRGMIIIQKQRSVWRTIVRRRGGRSPRAGL